MQFEVEKKYWVNDFDFCIETVNQLGGQFAEPVEQADQYFQHPSRDFTSTDEVLRLRASNDNNYITYKGARIDATTKTRHELELPLAPGKASFQDFTELLSLLGFSPIMTVRKKRCKALFQWEGREVEICLDEIDQLGTFVELETTSDAQNLDAAKAVLVSLAKHLNLDRDERRSYLELLLHQLAPPQVL